MLTFQTFAIVCPLVALAGFVDAIAGGGGLISLPAYLLAGLPPHVALGTNKTSSTMGTSLAVWRYARRGFIPWNMLPLCLVCSFAGSQLGARMTLWLSEATVEKVMLIVLPLTALYLLLRKDFARDPKPLNKGVALALAAVVALVVGVYDGFYGPGTGTFLVIGLNGLAHLPVLQASGLAKALNLTSNIAALSVFVLGGVSLLPLGVTAGLFSIFGNWLGTKVFFSKGTAIARPIILAVLALFFAKILLS